MLVRQSTHARSLQEHGNVVKPIGKQCLNVEVRLDSGGKLNSSGTIARNLARIVDVSVCRACIYCLDNIMCENYMHIKMI